MSDRPSQHAELLLLCGKVRDDVLTAEDARRLDALLQDNDQAKAMYVRYMSVLSLLECRGISQSSAVADSSDEIEHDVYSELLEMEQQADAELVHDVGQLRSGEQRPLRINGAARWLIEYPAVWSAAAAVLAIAVVLVVMLSGQGTSLTNVTPPMAEQGQTLGAATAVVATLTVEHDAQWASVSLAPGSPLYAGQRLELIEGFAEIFTQRGAVAILEAPATIELIDNNNALRLHSGKLVGICETDSSKGLLVRTPHMDITDLGTRFGVAIDDRVGTLAEVFEGEISIVSTGDKETISESVQLRAGQSLVLDAAGQKHARDAMPQAAFDDLTAINNGIAELSGQAVWLGTALAYRDASTPWPSDRLCVFEETRSQTLLADVPAIAQRAGRYRFENPDADSVGVVPANTKVRSYVVLFNPLGTQAAVQRQAQVRFEGRVLGVVASDQQAKAFIDACSSGPRPLFEPLENKYHDPWPGENPNDFVVLGKDLQTLTVNFHAATGGFDMIRVLVEAESP